MKKVVMILSILAMFGFANAQFSKELTSEVPNLRVNAMGGIYSLIETSNYADFPQRLLTGQEGAWLGKDGGNVWGLARFNLNNFIGLPMPIAWQVSAEQSSMVTVNDVFGYVGLGFLSAFPNPGYDPDGFWGMAYESTNRVNSCFSIGISKQLLAGVGIKFYSNGNSAEDDYDDDALGMDYNWNNSFWGLETTWGATMILDDNHFVDASIDFDVWNFSSEYVIDGDDQYKEGIVNCDGIMNIGVNGRYYAKGEKVDYAPYMNFNYFKFSSSEDTETAPGSGVYESDKYDASLFNITLGSGVHYKPTEGVKVYNEFEFRYQSVSWDNKDEVNTESNDNYANTFTLLPTYRCGVELSKQIDPKTWWGFNSVQLWGGFNKTFTNILNGDSSDDDETNTNDVESSSTDPTFEDVSVTTGAEFQNGNFKIQFETTVGNLQFDFDPLSNMSFGLVYMFK